MKDIPGGIVAFKGELGTWYQSGGMTYEQFVAANSKLPVHTILVDGKKFSLGEEVVVTDNGHRLKITELIYVGNSGWLIVCRDRFGAYVTMNINKLPKVNVPVGWPSQEEIDHQHNQLENLGQQKGFKVAIEWLKQFLQ